jgi:hypothetical protein
MCVRAVRCLQLILRAINQARSAYFAVRLRVDCFDTFRVGEMVQTAVYAKVRVVELLRRLRATLLVLVLVR